MSNLLKTGPLHQGQQFSSLKVLIENGRKKELIEKWT